MKTRKRGFTLIELVIVIAAIAILSSILIPTFVSLSKNAEAAADSLTVRELNLAASVAENDIQDYDDLQTVIEDKYGHAYSQTIAPRTARYGNHFWFDNSEKKFLLSTIEDLPEKGEDAISFNSPNSNIVNGYTLVDASGSELANLISGIENICSKTELRSLVDTVIRMHDNGGTYLDNLISYLGTTAIVNSQGTFRFEEVDDVFNLYFPNQYVSLGTQKIFTYDMDTNTADIHKTSLGYPIIGDGMYGREIEIKDTMYFGSRTFIVEENCEITLVVNVNSVEELKNVFAAEATNAYVALAGEPGTKYLLVEDRIEDASTREVVYKGLEYTEDVGVLDYAFPYTEKVSESIDVEKNWLTGEITSQAYISVLNSNISAVVPKGVKADSSQLTLSITPLDISDSNFVATGYATNSIDVHVEGVSKQNNVPLIISVGSILPKSLNGGAIKLYHIEGGQPTLMQRVDHVDSSCTHNSYSYNPNTGEVIVALKSFSELVTEVDTSNKWTGETAEGFASGSGAENDPYIISTVEELAYLAQEVNGGENFYGKHFKLNNDLVINSWDLTKSDIEEGMTYSKPQNYCAKDFASSATNDPAFEQKDKAYKTWIPIGNGSNEFSGIFDGNNKTISGLFKLHYDDPMNRDPMGLFGWVHNATIKDLTIDDSFIYTYGGTVGLVTGYASGVTTIQNVAVTNNFVTSYNYPLGGIVGYMWSSHDDDGDHLFLDHVTIDSSNLLESLWGTYDSQVGGLVGRAHADTTVAMTNCEVWPEMSLYNDCCANYQWFAYRYSGMLIGYVAASDRADYITNKVECSDVLIKYGEWTDQYYCELKSLGKGSYNGEHEWKYTRIGKDQVLKDDQGNVIGCDVSKTGHTSHAQYPEDEDHCAINITFNQLFGGGQGVHGETPDQFIEMKTAAGKAAGITIGSYTSEPGEKPDYSGSFTLKFPNTESYLYRVGNQNTVTLGTLFEGVAGTNIDPSQVSVTFENKQGTSATPALNTSTWQKGTIKFNGTGVIRVNLVYYGQTVKSLNLEIVDARNSTSAINAENYNVCLLANTSTGNSTIKVSNGYSFYGNGFTVTNRSNGEALNSGAMSAGYFEVTKGATLDNLVLDCAIYPRAYIYNTSGQEYVQEPSNLTRTDGSKKYYGYQYSAVAVSGGGTISNCYIKGARNNILVNGNATILNTVCDRGSLSNIYMTGSSEETVTLDNVTTIQYLSNDDFGAGKRVEGVGLLVGNEEGNNPNIVINNSLTQYNWVCSTDKDGITSSTVASTLIGKALEQSKYVHSSNSTNYVNMGLLVFNTQNVNITDNRANHHYEKNTITLMPGVSGQVYSVLANYGTVAVKDSNYAYSATTNAIYAPVYSISGLPTTLPAGETHIWNDGGTIKIQFPLGESYDLNIDDYVTFKRYSSDSGETVSVTCSGASAINGHVLTFTNSGASTILIQASNAALYGVDGELFGTTSYTLRIPVEVLTPDTSWKDAEITVNTTANTTGVKINSSGDRYFWFDIFDGLTITDYDKDGNATTLLDGSNSTSKKNFVAKIVTISPTGDLLGGSSRYDTATTLTITLNDGRVLILSMVRTECSNSPGKTKQVYLNYDSSKNSLYYVTNSAASSSSVSPAMDGKTFNCVYRIYGYKFTGNSGKRVVNDNSHYVACGLYNGAYTPPSTGIKPTATYSPTKKYTIMFDTNGGKCGQSVGYTTSSIASITLPTPTRYGYAFDGWYTAATGGTKRGDAGATYTPTASETLYAHWKAPFDITFDSDGGTTAATIRDYSGESVTLPISTREGDWLVGWFDGDHFVGEGGASYTIPERNVTLTAHWSPIYTVSYNMTNGGNVDHDSDTYEGTALILPTPTNGPKPTFEGWFTAASGGSKIGGAGDNYTPKASITLYAQWSTNIPITFDANGGTCSTSSLTYDGVTPITLPTATRDGYQFNGWFTAKSDGTKIGNAGGSYTPSEADTLYAQWTGYTVTYNANGGSVSPLSANGIVTLPTPTRTGYTFNGWYTAASGGSKIGNGGAPYTPTADIPLHAQWTINSYKVSITTSNSTTTVSVNGTNISNGGSVAYNSVVKVVLSYSQSKSLTFTIKQGNTNVTYYSNESCTSSTTSKSAGTYFFKMPAGDVTINSSSTASSSCVLPNTLITMADGTQKEIQYIVPGDMLLVFNHETGELDVAPVTFNEKEEAQLFTVIHLVFDNGANVGVISEHGFFDLDTMRYEYIDESNYLSFVGHRFYTIDGSSTALVDAYLAEEFTEVYSLPTFYHLNSFTENILSMPGGITGLFNIFDYSESLQYDQQAMQSDIEAYGLLSAEDLAPYGVDELMFEAYAGKYLNVALGKGILTEDYLMYLIERYGGYTA